LSLLIIAYLLSRFHVDVIVFISSYFIILLIGASQLPVACILYSVSSFFVFFRDFPARSVVRFHNYVVDVASCFYLSWIYCRFPSAGGCVNTICMSRPLAAAPLILNRKHSSAQLLDLFDTTSTVTTTDSSNYVHFGCLNICSWNNKFDDVVALISDFDLSVLCLTEAWVDEDSSVVNRCRSSSFSVIDQPRSRSCDDFSVNHGGVAIVAAPGLSLSPLPHGPPLSCFEASACLVSSGRRRVAIAVIYRPGSHAVTSAFFDDLAAFLERLAVFSLPIFIAGDLNIRLDRSDDHHSVQLRSVFSAFGLLVSNSGPTHYRCYCISFACAFIYC
jgi:Endonuclease/Exonuclease/phosphatase family